MNINIFSLGHVGAVTAGCLARQGPIVVATQQCIPLAALRQLVTARHHVIDVNGWPKMKGLPARYEGLCR